MTPYMLKKFKIILLANWGLGLEVLKTLDDMDNVDIAVVVTQYDARSTDPWKNSVYDYAAQCGYTTLVQKEVSFSKMRATIVSEGIDLLICHSFMRILPVGVLSAPKEGSINIHASLLPKYRGPSPTYWVLQNREQETGLTCHYMDEGVDTGDIIHQAKVIVKPGDTVENVIDRQKEVVAELLHESLARLSDKNFQATVQDSSAATLAPKPSPKG